MGSGSDSSAHNATMKNGVNNNNNNNNHINNINNNKSRSGSSSGSNNGNGMMKKVGSVHTMGGNGRQGGGRRAHGTATDPQSVAARTRREKFSDRIRTLQGLVPNAERLDTVSMLGRTLDYVTFLQHQVWSLYHGFDPISNIGSCTTTSTHEKWKDFIDHHHHHHHHNDDDDAAHHNVHADQRSVINNIDHDNDHDDDDDDDGGGGGGGGVGGDNKLAPLSK